VLPFWLFSPYRLQGENMKRLILIVLFVTTSAFAQNYDCSSESAMVKFKLDQKKLNGSLMTDLGTRLVHSISFTGASDGTTAGSYDLLDAKGSHGKLKIAYASTYHRSGVLGTNVSVAVDYLGTTFKFYECTVKTDIIVLPTYHQCGRAGCPE
jgi:hypothetical protein